MHVKPFVVLAVAGWAAASTATAAASPPDNDAFADAAGLEVGHELTGSLTEATVELGEAGGALNGGPFHTVWFRYRARHTARVTVDTGGSGADTVLSAYAGHELSTLKPIASDDDSSPSGNLGSTIRFRARRGHVYRIAVDSFYSDPAPDDYKVWLSDGSVAGKGVTMTADPGQTVESVRSRGLYLRVTARRRVRVGIAFQVSRQVANELGLDKRVLGRAGGIVDYNQSLPCRDRTQPRGRRRSRGRAEPERHAAPEAAGHEGAEPGPHGPCHPLRS